jgi:hypothetical protein
MNTQPRTCDERDIQKVREGENNVDFSLKYFPYLEYSIVHIILRTYTLLSSDDIAMLLFVSILHCKRIVRYYIVASCFYNSKLLWLVLTRRHPFLLDSLSLVDGDKRSTDIHDVHLVTRSIG